MAFLLKRNNCKSTLSGGISAGDLTLVVANASPFPVTGDFIITIWNKTHYPDPGDDSGMEILKVTSVSGTTFTVQRGLEGTTPQPHNSGVAVEMLVTVAQIKELEDEFGNYLRKDNTTSYTPTLDYHPATKLYVDSQIQGENHWDLNSGGTLVPHIPNANVDLGTGSLTARGGVILGSSLTGLLKATLGVIDTAISGIDYETPLTFISPLNRAGNTVSIIDALTGIFDEDYYTFMVNKP